MSFLKQKRYIVGERAITLLWIVLFMLPVLTFVFQNLFSQVVEQSLVDLVVWKMFLPSVFETIKLIICVLFCTSIIAYGLAYYTALYRFPFHRLVSWGVILTFAMPAYVLAYTYSDMFSITGVFTLLNIPFRGFFATVFIFTIAFVPYIYIPLHTVFSQTLRSYVEQGEVMSLSSYTIWRKIILPLTLKPYLLGATFVVFEILSDFAIVQYLGVRTVNVVLQLVWLNYGSMALLAYLATVVMLIVIIFLIWVEWKKRRTYTVSTTQLLMPQKRQLRGWKKIVVPLLFLMYMAVTLVIPIAQLVVWSLRRSEAFRLDLLIQSLINSVFIAVVVSVLIIIIAVLLNHVFYNVYMKKLQQLYHYCSLFLYGFPSLLIAISILTMTYGLPAEFIAFIGPAALGVGMIIIAYVIRFQSVGFNQIVAADLQHGNTLREAAYVLGYKKVKVFLKVELGVLKVPIIMTTMLLSLDILKELTMVLFLRPLNFELLSTSIYRYVADESMALAAPYSLTLIAMMVCLIIGVKVYERYSSK